MSKRVILISMPFAGINLPALGPPLLKASLTRQGIACDIEYFDLDFFARYFRDVKWGWKLYIRLLHRRMEIGSWLFAQHLFGRDGRAVALRSPLLDDDESDRFEFDFYLSLVDRIEGYLESCYESVDWEDCGLVGFTSMFNQNLASMALADLIKQRHPEMVIVFGGANADGCMGPAILEAFDQIDFVFQGEADHSFPVFAEAILSGRAPEPSPGVVGRALGDPELGSRLTTDLDSLPNPDFGDYFDRLKALGLAGLPNISLPLEASRGCWWGAKHHCTFCGLNGQSMAFRSKSAVRMLDEIDDIVTRYGVRQISFTDNILNNKYFDDFLPDLAGRDRGVKIFFESKANLSSKKVLLMSRAGIHRIQPGIESLSTRVLQLMKKGTTLIHNVACLKHCRAHGVEAVWCHLHGFPGENLEDYRGILEVIPSLHHLFAPAGFVRIEVHRFSPYFDTPEALGLTNIRSKREYRSIYPFRDDLVGDLAYSFEYDYSPPREEGLDEFIQGPVHDAIRTWQKRFAAGAQLKCFHDSAQGIVVDTRSARRRATILDGFELAVLRSFDDGTSIRAARRGFRPPTVGTIEEPRDLLDPLLCIEDVRRQFEGCLFDRLAVDRHLPHEERFEGVVRDLVGRRILLREGHTLLALPLEEAVGLK